MPGIWVATTSINQALQISFQDEITSSYNILTKTDVNESLSPVLFCMTLKNQEGFQGIRLNEKRYT